MILLLHFLHLKAAILTGLCRLLYPTVSNSSWQSERLFFDFQERDAEIFPKAIQIREENVCSMRQVFVGSLHTVSFPPSDFGSFVEMFWSYCPSHFCLLKFTRTCGSHMKENCCRFFLNTRLRLLPETRTNGSLSSYRIMFQMSN